MRDGAGVSENGTRVGGSQSTRSLWGVGDGSGQPSLSPGGASQPPVLSKEPSGDGSGDGSGDTPHATWQPWERVASTGTSPG